MIAKNLPGIPQCEELDFLTSLHNFATSVGEVLIWESFSKMSSFGGSSGAGSISKVRCFDLCVFVNVRCFFVIVHSF